MHELANIILPVFGLMGVGYGAARIGLLPGKVAEGLGLYVFNLAIPLLAFRVISKGSLPDVSPWLYWLSYFAGVAGVWLLVALLARFLLRSSPLVAVMAGCGASYSNTVMLGLPLVLTAFGEAGGVPLLLLLSVHLPVMLFAGIASGEWAQREGAADWRKIARDTVVAVTTNPIIIGIAAALLWRVTGWDMPFAPAKIINTIADTAIPCALIAMGLTLARYGLKGELGLVAIVLAGKLVLHPLIVFVVAHIVGLPPIWAGVATLFAAAPTGINAYLLTNRYQAGAVAVSGAILLGSGLSIVTISLLLRYLTVP
mgnify:CR=1 FL=1